MLLLDIIDSTYTLNCSIGLAVYVDDVTVYLSGSFQLLVATQVASVTDHLITCMQDWYQLEVSASKSFVVALSRRPSSWLAMLLVSPVLAS